MDACEACGKTDGLKRCTACKSVVYCSTACQKRDWPAHQRRCGAEMAATAVEVQVGGRTLEIPDSVFAPGRKEKIVLKEVKPEPLEQQHTDFVAKVVYDQLDGGLNDEITDLYKEARQELTNLMHDNPSINEKYVDEKLDQLLGDAKDAFNLAERVFTPPEDYKKTPEKDFLRTMKQLHVHVASAVNFQTDTLKAKDYEESVAAKHIAMAMIRTAERYADEYEVPLIDEKILDALDGGQSAAEAFSTIGLSFKKKEGEEELSEREKRAQRRTAKFVEQAAESVIDEVDERNGDGLWTKVWQKIVSVFSAAPNNPKTTAAIIFALLILLLTVVQIWSIAFGTHLPEVQFDNNLSGREYREELRDGTVVNYVDSSPDSLVRMEGSAPLTQTDIIEERVDQRELDLYLASMESQLVLVETAEKELLQTVDERILVASSENRAYSDKAHFAELKLQEAPVTRNIAEGADIGTFTEFWAFQREAQLMMAGSREELGPEYEIAETRVREDVELLRDPNVPDKRKIQKMKFLESLALHWVQQFAHTLDVKFLAAANAALKDYNDYRALRGAVAKDFGSFKNFYNEHITGVRSAREAFSPLTNLFEPLFEAFAGAGLSSWGFRYLFAENFLAEMQAIFTYRDERVGFLLNQMFGDTVSSSIGTFVVLSVIIGLAVKIVSAAGGFLLPPVEEGEERSLDEFWKSVGVVSKPITAIFTKTSNWVGKLALTFTGALAAGALTGFLAGDLRTIFAEVVAVQSVSTSWSSDFILPFLGNMFSLAGYGITKLFFIQDVSNALHLIQPSYFVATGTVLAVGGLVEAISRRYKKRYKESIVDNKPALMLLALGAGAITLYSLERFASYAYLNEFYTTKLLSQEQLGLDLTDVVASFQDQLDQITKYTNSTMLIRTNEHGAYELAMTAEDLNFVPNVPMLEG